MTPKGDGLMNIMEDDNFDYRAYTRETPPDPAKILRGTAERRRRFDEAMSRLSVRLDEDVFEQFRQLTAEGQSVERLINQALREWLSAQGMKELVRAEIQRVVQQSLSSTQTDVT
jgi:uncharacterized protein (DUF4415 family)